MVQAVENWTCVTGELFSLTHEPGSDRLQLTLSLVRAESVAGFPSLLKAQAVDRLVISLPPDFSGRDQLHEGDNLKLPVRMARGPKLFAHPDWLPGKPSPLCP
jgi:hypothetical protein